jgi:hypothetical protein
MQPTVLRLHRTAEPWLRASHYFYAGLFAFVLPLICWGAQATPGHPHARAHFVFLMPPFAVYPTLAATDSQQPASSSDHTAHGAVNYAEHQAAAKAEQQPVGRSVPSMLGFSLLLLIGLAHTLLPRSGDKPIFAGWITSPIALSVIPTIPTPPPR